MTPQGLRSPAQDPDDLERLETPERPDDKRYGQPYRTVDLTDP
jgi:hypothetical protein